jgi:hypothetical protein
MRAEGGSTKFALSSSRIETRISLSCDRRYVLHSFADACRYDSHVARWLRNKFVVQPG